MKLHMDSISSLSSIGGMLDEGSLSVKAYQLGMVSLKPRAISI